MNQELGHSNTPVSWVGLVWGLTWRASLNPALARDLLLVLWAFRRRNWWRRFPFFPVPSGEYMRWRMYTAYGSERVVPPLDDVIRFARWRHRLLSL